MLQQVVGNLLSNAIRYTVRGSITVRSRLDDGGIRVEVEDTGIGMTPEDQARIFEDFFQVDGAHRAIGEGYGLGLAVAGQIGLWGIGFYSPELIDSAIPAVEPGDRVVT